MAARSQDLGLLVDFQSFEICSLFFRTFDSVSSLIEVLEVEEGDQGGDTLSGGPGPRARAGSFLFASEHKGTELKSLRITLPLSRKLQRRHAPRYSAWNASAAPRGPVQNHLVTGRFLPQVRMSIAALPRSP